MSGRLCLILASLLLFALSRASSQPNILFILADDLGWSDTTLYGQTTFYQTPHLERLATRGMTFNRAYTASPLCSPTRSSILTGLHPARTGLTAPNCHTPQITLQASTDPTAAADRKLTRLQAVTRLDPKYETLSERLQREGYATAHFGKWHLGAAPYSPLQHGFEVDIPHWHGPGPAGSYVAPWKFADFKEDYPGEHIEDRMGDEIVRFLEGRKESDQPFFINYWQFSVHAPFDAKAGLIEKHRARIDPEDAQRSPTYAAMVESLDDNVGVVLDAIDRLGLAENTIIIFTSDNGGNMYNEVDGTTPTSNRPLRGGKGNNWDGGVRVPAIVVWPGQVEPGSRSDLLVTSTDYYPTLLEMTGLEPSTGQSFDGASIVPALQGKDQTRETIFTYFPHSTGVPDTLPPSTAVYEEDWKLLRLFHNRSDGRHEHRLFNLATDMGESSDVAASHPERVAAMSARLDAFLTGTQAVTPRLNPQWDPASAALEAIGWRATKNVELDLEPGVLRVRCTGEDPHFRVKLSDPLPAGRLSMRARVKGSTAGPVEIRWEEKGVRPPYGKDRLAVAPTASPGWQEVEFEIEAAHPVPSFRVDPGKGEGDLLIDRWTIAQDGEVIREWEFNLDEPE